MSMLAGTELNLEGLEMQKWKQNGTFFVSFPDDSKTLVTVWAKHFKKCTLKDLFDLFQKMA